MPRSRPVSIYWEWLYKFALTWWTRTMAKQPAVSLKDKETTYLRKSSEDWFREKDCDIRHESALFHSARMKQYGRLSNCNRILIFPSEFSVLPQKLSEYLRTDSPSDANTRKIRTLRKLLNTSNLYTGTIFSSCNKHHFSMWYCLFQGPKCAISHHEMGGTTG